MQGGSHVSCLRIVFRLLPHSLVAFKRIRSTQWTSRNEVPARSHARPIFCFRDSAPHPLALFQLSPAFWLWPLREIPQVGLKGTLLFGLLLVTAFPVCKGTVTIYYDGGGHVWAAVLGSGSGSCIVFGIKW